MKLFFQSTLVFLGTLLAAALVALGEPGQAEVHMVAQAPAAVEPAVLVSLLGFTQQP